MFTVVMVVGVLTIVDASSTSPIVVVEQTKLINDFDVAGFKLAINIQDYYEFGKSYKGDLVGQTSTYPKSEKIAKTLNNMKI